MVIPTFITVRTWSERLPGKCLLKMGENTVLSHVIKRCQHAEFRPIICTTTNERDDEIAHIAKIEEVECYRGSIDPQTRWMECAAHFDIWSFHALDCDDPYFDPLEVERSFSYMNDLSLHCVMPTVSSSRDGLGMMGTSLSMRTGETKILPERRSSEELIRMTLDYEEDYWFLATLARLGGTPEITRDNIELIACHPIEQVNLFRNKDWKENQCREAIQ